MRVAPISSRLRYSLSGGSATWLSAKTSTAVPPAPKLITGPNTGSRAMPTMISRALGLSSMGSMVTPLMCASGAAAATASIISR